MKKFLYIIWSCMKAMVAHWKGKEDLPKRRSMMVKGFLVMALVMGAVSGLNAQQHGGGLGLEASPWQIDMGSNDAASVADRFSYTSAAGLTITGPGYYEITGTASGSRRVVVNYSPPQEVLTQKAVYDEAIFQATMDLQEAFAVDPLDRDEHQRLLDLVTQARNEMISYLAPHTVHVRLNGVSIVRTGASAFAINGSSIVNMMLMPETANVLTGSDTYAGIWVQYNASTNPAQIVKSCSDI